MHTATLNQIGETLLIEVPRSLAEARCLKPGDSVNLDLRAIEVGDTDQDELASQLAIGDRIMQRDYKILHALAQ